MTSEDRYLLICLIEEAAEIQKAATKILRFGLTNNHPDRYGTSNKADLSWEYDDLQAVIRLLREQGIIYSPDSLRIETKKGQLREYMNAQ